MNIPLSRPSINGDDIAAVRKTLLSGWLAHGDKNHEFEEQMKKLIGVKYALSLNSCTSALFLAIKALDLRGEILVPSFTFVASVNAIITAGCTPRFVDIEYGSCNMDISKAEDKINSKTVAIMPVHFAGQSCDMEHVMKLARKYRLAVIEDSAEALGATFNGRLTGSFGIGCFSFFPTKNITTGEGGALTTNNKKIYQTAKALSAHGILSSTFSREKNGKFWLRDAILPGYNFRMSNILAALGVEQFKRLEDMNGKRRELAGIYNRHLDSDLFDLSVEEKSCRHVYQMYTIKLRDILRLNFINALKAKGIGVSVHFDPPAHLHRFYRRIYAKEYLPITERVAKTIVTLPLYPGMQEKEALFISKISNQVGRELRKGKR